MDKLSKLKDILSGMGRILVAYSGGVDSTFLLEVAYKTLGKENVLAVIAKSPTYPDEEVQAAKAICDERGFNYRIIQTDECADENFLSNPKERCYYCKKELFTKLVKIAQEDQISVVVDGSNLDDNADFRPGQKAKKELGVMSPLQEAGLTKREIRDLSKELGLPTWDKPAMACLASRIPYGTRIDEGILGMVREGEGFLRSLGFRQNRVRHHQTVARIEVEPEHLPRIMEKNIISAINKKFEELGYVYVTIDLKGFRSGSMNEGFYKELGL